MARFFLDLGGARILSLDDLKAHFDPQDALDRFRHDALQRWLAEQHLESELHAVEAIDAESDDETTIRELAAVFGVAGQAEKSLEELDKMLCGAASDEEMRKLFEGANGERNCNRLESLAESGHTAAQCQLAYLYLNGIGVPENKKKGYEWSLRAAEAGDAFEQWRVGSFLKTGNAVEQDLEKAFEWFLKSANQGNADAQVEVGKAFFSGDGVQKNDIKAKEWFAKAAEQDLPNGLFWHGLMLNNSKNENDLKKAVRAFERAAELGHADACDMLGNCYLNGDGVEENAAKAVEWFRKASERGSVEGKYDLGKCLFCGRGVKKDVVEAIKHLIPSSEGGNIPAKALLAHCYFLGKGVKIDNEKAFSLASEAAENGDPLGQRILGQCYYQGRGIEENLNEAIKWWKKAEKQGEPHAIGFLGILYLTGEGVPQDAEKGFRMLKNSAEGTGEAYFQHKVGACLENGWGVARNKNEAAMWYKLAADQRDEDTANTEPASQTNGFEVKTSCDTLPGASEQDSYKKAEELLRRGEMYRDGRDSQKDLSKARRCFEQAAEMANAKAMSALGILILESSEPDTATAIRWLEKAAERGDATGQCYFGMVSELGFGVAKDPEKAFRLYRSAAMQDHPRGQYLLSRCYSSGVGCSPNAELAMEWLQKAAENENPEAMNCLGELYRQGRGIAKDKQKAIYWSRKAYEKGVKEAGYRLSLLGEGPTKMFFRSLFGCR